MNASPAQYDNEQNYIRRERMRNQNKKKVMEEMRASLPVYTLDEIRQHKLPYQEAILVSLEEKNYMYTSTYIRKLFTFQEKLREEAGPLSPLWTDPILLHSKKELKIVRDGLMKIEDLNDARDFKKECEEMLRMAVDFAFFRDSWQWLGEQLLIDSLHLAKEHAALDRIYEALSRYALGKFLLEALENYEGAVDHLDVAHHLSEGKDWTTKIIFPSDIDSLFLKASLLLYQCFIHQAEKLMETDYIRAGDLATQARRRASEACYPEGEITALMLRGMCQLSYNDTKGAVSTFTKAYYIQSKIGSEKGICDARIHIARAYLLDGNTTLSLNTLLMLRESAEDFNLPYYLAQAYRHLGEYFLNNGQASRATPLLAESLKIFQDGGYVKESEQVRNLEAISCGLQMFPTYVNVLVRGDDPQHLGSLIDWKDSRETLIGTEDATDPYSVDLIIQESLAEIKSKKECEAVFKENNAGKITVAKGVKIADKPDTIFR